MQYNPAMLDDALLLPVLNRLLDTQPALQARLARHVGKQAVLRLPPLEVGFAVLAAGRLGRRDPEAATDTEIRVGPDRLLALLAGDREALKQAQVSGDGVLASDIAAAFDGFDWALALRPWLGDIAAARAGQALAAFGQWRQQAHAALGRSLAEYATFEAGMLADRLAVRRFVAEVDALRDDAARLEARLTLLEAKVR
jgi:ubiquinone biosynthesis protein UbiJ